MSKGPAVEGQCFNCKAHALHQTMYVREGRLCGPVIYCGRCKRIQSSTESMPE
jgi:hypothetical protein